MNLPKTALLLCAALAGCVATVRSRPPSPLDPANPDAVGPSMPATQPTTSAVDCCDDAPPAGGDHDAH